MLVRTLMLSGSAALLLAASLFSACATGGDITDDGPADAAPDVTVAEGGSTSSSGGSSGGASSGGSSSGGSSSSSGGPAECGDLLVNEVGDSEDFVEIYNPADCDVDLGDYTIVYRAAAGTDDVIFYENGTDTLAARSYFVVGEAAMTPKDAQFASGAIGGAGGQVAIKRGATVVDSMGYGTSNGSYVEGDAAPAPGNGSVSRTPNGTDTDDNANDFTDTAATPGEPND